MKNSHLSVLIAVFLAVIYSVPVVQTGYEYATNKDHRIQMADLMQDLFVIPLKKHNAAVATLEGLSADIDNLHAVIQTCREPAGDSALRQDRQAAIDYADDAVVKITMLLQNVVNYNRHIQGEKNRFAATDTVKPYYRKLQLLRTGLENIAGMLQSGEPADAVLPKIEAMKAPAKETHILFGPRKGISGYPALTMVALRRIMVGADYLRPYEKEMEKNSIFANTIRPLMQLGYYIVFSDLGDKGIPGKKGWFFYRPDVEYLTKPYISDKRSTITDPNDVPIHDAAIDSIKAFRDQLASMDIDLLVVIMPGKPSIYPDLLAPEMKIENAGTFSHSLRIMDELSRVGVETIDLFSPFVRERKNDSIAGDSIYLHTDTHFRNRAVRLTARVIADRIKQFDWFEQGNVEYGIDTLIVPRYGDIAEMTKLSALKIHMLNCSFPPEQTVCCQVYRIDSGARSGKTLYRDDNQHSKILILGDSFSRIYQTDEPRSAGWISHLAYELGQPVASIVNNGGASTLVRESLARKPNLLKGKKAVVWEIVERDFRFGADGWKDVKIAADR